MKKVVLAAVALVPSLLFAQEEFTVKGQVGKLSAPAKVYLQYAEAGQRKLDSAAITNGSFTFNGAVQEPTMALIVLSEEGKPLRQLSNPDYRSLYLSKGLVDLKGASLKTATVTGNKINLDYAQYQKSSEAIRAEMEKIGQQFQAATDAQREDEAFVEGLQTAYAKLMEEQEKIDLAFVAANPNSFIALTILEEKLDESNVVEFQQLFQALSPSLKDSKKGKAIAESMNNLSKLAVGQVAPDFTLPDVNGKEVALSSLRGKYVLVDFWASWCGPCRQENPNVVKAYNTFKDKNFTVFGVSLDRPGQKQAWVDAIEKDGLGQWTNVSDLKFWNSPVVKLYAIKGIPQNYLLDPQGRIIGSNLRGEELEAKLAEVLN